MSDVPTAFESSQSQPRVGAHDLARIDGEAGNRPASGRFRRAIRRLWRTFGLLLVIAMFTFLMNQHLLRPFMAPGDGVAHAAWPPLPDPAEKRRYVVCFGYADLEGGITALHPSQTGRVDKLFVTENETVLAGAPLLHLDDRAARLRVDEARALLNEAVARLAKAEKGPEQHKLRIAEQQATIQVARYRLAASRHSLGARHERMKGEAIGRIRNDPTITEEVASTAERVKEFEEVIRQEEKRLASLELQDPLVDLERVKAEVAAMRARSLQSEQVLEEHTLRAPENGKVLRIFVTPSELLTAPPKRMAIQFCPDSPRIIRAEVEQAFAGRVEVGQPALIEDDVSAATTWRGRVMRVSDWYTERRQIAEELLQFKDVRTLECLISLDAGQRPLRISQRVRVIINRPGD